VWWCLPDTGWRCVECVEPPNPAEDDRARLAYGLAARFLPPPQRRPIMSADRRAAYLEHPAHCARFAAKRGWKLARTTFSLAELAAGRRSPWFVRRYPRLRVCGLDHTAHFVWGRGRPAGILTQPYADVGLAARLTEAFAQRGVPLVATTPPEPSWWFPGWTVSVLFLPKPVSRRLSADEIDALDGEIRAAIEEANRDGQMGL